MSKARRTISQESRVRRLAVDVIITDRQSWPSHIKYATFLNSFSSYGIIKMLTTQFFIMQIDYDVFKLIFWYFLYQRFNFLKYNPYAWTKEQIGPVYGNKFSFNDSYSSG